MAGSTKEKKHTTGMDKDLRKPSGLPRPNLPPHPLTEIEDSGPDDKPPAEVSKTVLGRVEGKSWDVIGVDGVSYETAGGVGVKGDHEEKCEVVGIPERFEALAADLVMGGCVHDEHDEQHEVAGDATGLFIMDILCGNLTDLYRVEVSESGRY